ncbi:MAG: 4Fe-4S dicluster domain-containing protein, partial [Sulfolobus sp.]|nr:4Fe-4S dicluster domain-containing protein [Sulfolobus sp.]
SSGKIEFKCVGCELEKNLSNFIEVIKEYNDKLGGISFISPSLKIESKEHKVLKTLPNTFFTRSQARKSIRDELPFILFEVSIDNEKCTLCESCVKWCPSSALKLVRDNNSERIEFDPTTCIGCNICVNVCPEMCKNEGRRGKIISVNKSKKYDKSVKILVSDELVKCRVCGAPIGSRKSLEYVKKIMKEKGSPDSCDDEWLERCPKHRAEYAFKKQFFSRFKPREKQ